MRLPRTAMSGGGLGTIRNFASTVREIRFDEVRIEAELAPRLLVVAPTKDLAEAVADLLAGVPFSPHFSTVAAGQEPRVIEEYDAVVVFGPGRDGRSRSTKHWKDATTPVIPFVGDDPASEQAARLTREAIIAKLPDRTPALGRHLLGFRAAAVTALVDETARANAQFALVANLPSVISLFGSIASVGADLVVLTKNQVMMAYKIAAVNGRDLHDQWGVIRELAPVVGAGFFWRTLAREAASFLPLAAGTIPKVTIAYTGTVAFGRAADFYYRSGRRPSREQMRAYYRQAAEAVKRLPLPLPSGNGDRSGGETSDKPS